MKCYIADAFTDTVFKGNPAAVCLPEQWIPDELMQNIARENNLSETAFTVTKGDAYELRWFTPGGEIDLCGHATLAAAYVLMRFVIKDRTRISFLTKSGELTVRKKDGRYELDMPSYPLHRIPVTEEMAAAVGFMPAEAWLGRDLICGSGHCHVIPMWAEKLKKQDFRALQASERSGILYCRFSGDRVFIAGETALYSVAELYVQERRDDL